MNRKFVGLCLFVTMLTDGLNNSTTQNRVLSNTVTCSRLTKKFPFFGDRKFLYCLNKGQPPVPILNQINSVYHTHPTS